MNDIRHERIPESPCLGCVPPERSAECHAKCRMYLEWEANKNRIQQARWKYKDSITYVSSSMLKLIRQNQRKK